MTSAKSTSRRRPVTRRPAAASNASPTSEYASTAQLKTSNSKLETHPSPSAPPSPFFTPARILFNLRARFNPIRHLTPDSLARALDLFHSGYLRSAALLWDAMERRDDVLQGVAAKRKKAAARLQWEILARDDSFAAGRHRAALEFFYNNLSTTHACDPQERGGLALLIKQMLDALGKKYAVHEISWQRLPNPAVGVSRSGGTAHSSHNDDSADSSSQLETPNSKLETAFALPRTLLTATFRFAPLWFFEGRTGQLRFLTEDTAAEGIDLAPGQWLVTVADGLMESCSIAYLFKHLPLRDWLVYCERNGMPGVRGVTDAAPGTPEWDAAREAVRDFGAEFNALMSRGTEIDPIDLSTRGELPYPALVERMDRAMATLWRGADLATLSKSQGLGASLQSGEADVLEQDDATLVSETLNAQVDAVVLRELFGDETPLAYFRLLPRQEAARQAYLDLVERLVKLGVPVTLAGLHERLGLPRPSPGEPTLPKLPATATNPTTPIV
jgi:phage gp29-like protein